MYYVSKRMEIAGSHQLALSYESKCSNIHGHNWIVTVYCRAATLGSVYSIESITLIICELLTNPV